MSISVGDSPAPSAIEVNIQEMVRQGLPGSQIHRRAPCGSMYLLWPASFGPIGWGAPDRSQEPGAEQDARLRPPVWR
jgi:hypothetical protein